MRVALISDIHGNLEALRSVLDVLEEADRIVCLGDLVGYYCQVNEVLDLLRALDPICILGNHDHFLLHGCPQDLPEGVRFGIDHADRVITKDHRDWLATLPLLWGGRLGSLTILAAHGSPWHPLTDYLYPDNPKLQNLASFDFDVLVFGQTHRPFSQLSNRPWLINPGAIGQSRQVYAVANLTVIDTETRCVEAIERTYDHSRVLAVAAQYGASESLGKPYRQWA